MNKFKVGEVVEVPESVMKRVPGIVVSFDEGQEKYLIRFGALQQLYFSEDEIELWDPKRYKK
ncbi:hypothetical protein [Aureibacillus halotolerans]|uniref:Uncharacterized protein n=1 Tax=Aureibacillus halotolerans TaxID=1508390 RepID=A0A4R6U7X1_9BACI|nr:hypothetical protein [Aureibacillus halotolerans]TDQ40859.1 hypothetical protein EV213_105205 [Aureibacillus halotolerans]